MISALFVGAEAGIVDRRSTSEPLQPGWVTWALGCPSEDAQTKEADGSRSIS